MIKLRKRKSLHFVETGGKLETNKGFALGDGKLF
jgi:hypothetical protein